MIGIGDTEFKALQKELKQCQWSGVHKTKSYQVGIAGLQADIEAIEKDMWELIKTDAELIFLLVDYGYCRCDDEK